LRTARTEAAEFDISSYLIALDGVSAWCLRASVKSILQGGLGHGWYPSPPEFRLHCDKLMRPIWDMLDRERREKRVREEMAADRPANIDMAARLRVVAKLNDFRMNHRQRKQEQDAGGNIVLDHERAERMKKIMAMPDAVEPTQEVLAYRRIIENALPDAAPPPVEPVEGAYFKALQQQEENENGEGSQGSNEIHADGLDSR